MSLKGNKVITIDDLDLIQRQDSLESTTNQQTMFQRFKTPQIMDSSCAHSCHGLHVSDILTQGLQGTIKKRVGREIQNKFKKIMIDENRDKIITDPNDERLILNMKKRYQKEKD